MILKRYRNKKNCCRYVRLKGIAALATNTISGSGHRNINEICRQIKLHKFAPIKEFQSYLNITQFCNL